MVRTRYAAGFGAKPLTPPLNYSTLRAVSPYCPGSQCVSPPIEQHAYGWLV
jgi:hypothetical protein